MATGVKEADVWVAADALLRAGEQPTVERVRLHLGRGSPNTVGPHLKAWFRGLSERLLAGQGGASNIPQVVTQAVSQVWETALAAARDEWAATVASERAELTKAQAAIDTDRASLAQEQDRLHDRETDLEASTKAAHAQAAAAETRLQAAEQQLRDNAQALKEIHSQLATSQDQIAALQQALQAAQTTHQEALGSAEARHTAHERRWLGEIDECRQALKRAQEALAHQHKSADAVAAQHQQTISQARAFADAQTRRAIKAETDVQTLTAKLEASAQAARVAQTHWESKSEQLTVQIDTLHHQLLTKDRQLELLMQAKIRRAAASTRVGGGKTRS